MHVCVHVGVHVRTYVCMCEDLETGKSSITLQYRGNTDTGKDRGEGEERS